LKYLSEMSSYSAALYADHVSEEAPDVEFMEHCLADIRANLLLFAETHDICAGLLDILDSCSRSPVREFNEGLQEGVE
jgi:hypothetical protein